MAAQRNAPAAEEPPGERRDTPAALPVRQLLHCSRLVRPFSERHSETNCIFWRIELQNHQVKPFTYNNNEGSLVESSNLTLQEQLIDTDKVSCSNAHGVINKVQASGDERH